MSILKERSKVKEERIRYTLNQWDELVRNILIASTSNQVAVYVIEVVTDQDERKSVSDIANAIVSNITSKKKINDSKLEVVFSTVGNWVKNEVDCLTACGVLNEFEDNTFALTPLARQHLDKYFKEPLADRK